MEARRRAVESQDLPVLPERRLAVLYQRRHRPVDLPQGELRPPRELLYAAARDGRRRPLCGPVATQRAEERKAEVKKTRYELSTMDSYKAKYDPFTAGVEALK